MYVDQFLINFTEAIILQSKHKLGWQLWHSLWLYASCFFLPGSGITAPTALPKANTMFRFFQSYYPISWRDSISRSLTRVSSVAGGDETTPPGQYRLHMFIHTYMLHMYIHVTYVHTCYIFTYMLHMFIHVTYLCSYMLHIYVHTCYICTYMLHMYIHVTYVHTCYLCTYMLHMYIHVTYVHTCYICTYMLHMYRILLNKKLYVVFSSSRSIRWWIISPPY
jgi:hypothetical protein